MRSARALAAVTVVVVAGVASADPAHARECKPAGDAIIEVDQRAIRTVKRMTATTRLYANGAWKRVVTDIDGTVARTQAGCLEPSLVAEIGAEIRDAAWTTTPRTAGACQRDQPRFTVYQRRGTALYTERTCNDDVLDPDSQHVLRLLQSSLQIPDTLDGSGLDRRGIRQECLDDPLAPGCH